MDVEKMKQATDVLLKKRLPHGPGPTPEGDAGGDARRWPRSHSRAQGSTDNVPDEMEGLESDSDEKMPMVPSENAPLQKGPSDPHGPKADSVSPDEFPETDAGIEDFRYAICMETNEAAGIDLWKIGL